MLEQLLELKVSQNLIENKLFMNNQESDISSLSLFYFCQKSHIFDIMFVNALPKNENKKIVTVSIFKGGLAHRTQLKKKASQGLAYRTLLKKKASQGPF
jgi:hypothetical protein